MDLKSSTLLVFFKQFTNLVPFIFKFYNCFVVIESHSKHENSITCKELCYCPCIYLLLKWCYNLYVCLSPGLTFRSFSGYIGIERNKNSLPVLPYFSFQSPHLCFHAKLPQWCISQTNALVSLSELENKVYRNNCPITYFNSCTT